MQRSQSIDKTGRNTRMLDIDYGLDDGKGTQLETSGQDQTQKLTLRISCLTSSFLMCAHSSSVPCVHGEPSREKREKGKKKGKGRTENTRVEKKVDVRRENREQ